MSEQRAVWCRHCDRSSPMEERCKLGIDIRAMVASGSLGRFYMLPCHTAARPHIEKKTCDMRSLFTRSEVEEQDRVSAEDVKQAVARLEATLPLVEEMKATAKEIGADYHRTTACPVCGKAIFLSCSIYNLHVHARCETEDCINFME